MKNSNAFARLTIKWNSKIDLVSEQIVSYYMKQLKEGATKETISDGIYDILTKNKFDSEAFEYIFNSVKLVDPKLTKAQYMKTFTNRKIDGKKLNLFDNIDNNATNDRIMSRIDDKVQKVIDRAERLKKTREKLNPYTIERSTYDVERTIETMATRSKSIQSKILDKKRGLKYSKLPQEDKKLLKSQISQLTRDLKEEQASYKKLRKQYDSLIKRKDSMNPVKFKKEYSDVLAKVEKDLLERQVPYELQQTILSSASQQVKTVARTELGIVEGEEALQQFIELKKSVKEDEILLAKWALNPFRTWSGTDICDEHAAHDEGYGKGVWIGSRVPRVPSHPACGCTVTYFIGKRKKK